MYCCTLMHVRPTTHVLGGEPLELSLMGFEEIYPAAIILCIDMIEEIEESRSPRRRITDVRSGSTVSQRNTTTTTVGTVQDTTTAADVGCMYATK